MSGQVRMKPTYPPGYKKPATIGGGGLPPEMPGSGKVGREHEEDARDQRLRALVKGAKKVTRSGGARTMLEPEVVIPNQERSRKWTFWIKRMNPLEQRQAVKGKEKKYHDLTISLLNPRKQVSLTEIRRI